ncbi:MAG: hypothetical protein LLG01_05545 [Planctomycetaceae bacterium]|nr:hypothetical protein [Planctomycetaceae bacterium]
MDASSAIPDGPPSRPLLGWFVIYALWLAALAALLTILLSGTGWSWQAWRHDFWGQFRSTNWDIKLTIYVLYLSVAMTFTFLNTSVVVSILAMHQAGIASNILGPQNDSYALALLLTVLLVGGLGAIASTIANLTDYHIYMLIFRSRRVARVRETHLYHVAARWFAKSPFGLLLAFNILPIPVDVARILAVASRYPLAPFALSNFLGRFVRYGAVAAITFWLGEKYGWIAPVGLLAVAVVLILLKLAKSLLSRRRQRSMETS